MYHYTESGLRNVWLVNGYTEHQTPYGHGVAIHDVSSLHRVIGKIILGRPHLTGAQFRFLRKEMGLSQIRLAQLLGSTEQTISLWERKGKIPKGFDRLMRVLYLETLKENTNVTKMIEKLIDLDDVAEGEIIVREGKRGWNQKLG